MSDKCTVFKQKKQVNIGGTLLDFSQPVVMGILNLTPDSFFASSRNHSVNQALRTAEDMLQKGAGILDLGAYSSRPGAAEIPAEEEIRRLIPAVEAISRRFPEAVMSIDTFRAEVAKEAIPAGAHIVNDISGGELDGEMFKTVASLRVPYILMHMRGTPETMSSLNHYENLIAEIMSYFALKIHDLRKLGVQDIILDPGFGFAKDSPQNFELMERLEDIGNLGLPVLAGISRKKMIWQSLGKTAAEALNGTTVLNTIALLKGADILRVHDVAEAVEAVKLTGMLKR